MPKNRYKTVTTETRVKKVTLPENWTILEDHIIYDMDTGLRVGHITYCSCDCNWCGCCAGCDEAYLPPGHVCLLSEAYAANSGKFVESTPNRMRLPKVGIKPQTSDDALGRLTLHDNHVLYDRNTGRRFGCIIHCHKQNSTCNCACEPKYCRHQKKYRPQRKSK